MLPKPPFVVGITGNLDPLGYDDDYENCMASPAMQELREQIFAILDWIRSEDGWLDPEGRRFDPLASDMDKDGQDPGWHGLGLIDTPILIISSLAPGIDTLVVEAALDYSQERDADIRVAAPLPFPIGPGTSGAPIYPRCSSFQYPGAKERFLRVSERIPPSALFEVSLDRDLCGGSLQEAEDHLVALDPASGSPMRYLRYRAAGDYVAVHSDLLLAIHDSKDDPPDPENLFSAGTSTIIECKRRGLTWELLDTANNFSWADNGPVLVVPWRRTKNHPSPGTNASEPEGVDGDTPWKNMDPLALLHPYDTLPGAGASAAMWQEEGNNRFRRVLKRQEEFNKLPVHASREGAELASMCGESIVPGLISQNQPETVTAAYARTLEPLSRIRRRAADTASRLDSCKATVLLRLFILIFSGALLFGLSGDWQHEGYVASPPPEGPPVFSHDPVSWIRTLLLFGTICSFASAAVIFHRYRRAGYEEKRYDYRALAEAFRVQFYWLLVGTGRSVSSNYMQRQRDELDWIRYAVSSAAIPLENSRRSFLALDRCSQALILDAARTRWVAAQADYFRKSSTGLAKRGRIMQGRGWILGATALLSILAMALASALPSLLEAASTHWFLVTLTLIVIGILLIILPWDRILAFIPRKPKATSRVPAGTEFLAWDFKNPKNWGFSLILATLIFPVTLWLGNISTLLPDQENWWITLTAAALLGGGASIAWVERNFIHELTRQYASMADLYSHANRRLADLISRYREAPPQTPPSPRILGEIHDLFYQVGCEALDENAEWLSLHRARPTELFMA
jgi:hypothetical protein